MFLVCNPDLEDFPQISQAINELMDLRMIHLVEPITSAAPSDGKKYSAYMIDIGLYTNSKPRNFNQMNQVLLMTKLEKIRLELHQD